jgi:signal transduction histidine kinase
MPSKSKTGISIFVRILIVFFCVNIATSGILLVVAFAFHRKAIEERTKETITQQLEILHDNFENDYRLDLKRSLEVLVSSSILDDYLTVSEFEKAILGKKIKQMFKQTIKTCKTYHNICFVEADGNVSISVAGKFRHKEATNLKQINLESLPSHSSTLGASVKLFQTLESIPLLLSGGYMEWFMPPRELQLEGPFMDENGILSLLAGVSKLDLDIGAFGGVIMIHQKLEKFFDGLRDVKFFDENLIWVFDSKHHLLQSPEKEETRLEPTKHLLGAFQGTPKLINVKEGLVAYRDFSIVPGKPFIRVVISIPAALLLKDFSSAVRFFSIVLVSSLVMVLLVAFYVSRYLSKPIIELADAANRLAEGDLGATVQLETTGEVQVLVNSFNQMVTDLKRQRNELSKSQQVAENANQAKSEFLANMSHELRTPLNHIIGFGELLVDKRLGELNEKQSEFLSDMLHSSKHLLSLINDILDLSKIEAGKLNLELSEVAIKELLAGSLVIIKERAQRRKIELKTAIDGIPTAVSLDERKIKQILYNLLSNSVKFTPEGGEVVLGARTINGVVRPGLRGEDSEEMMVFEYKAEAHDHSGESVRPCIEIWVSDTGIGIAKEHQDCVFHAFEQVEGSMNRKFDGTGLGLSLTKKLVELHGGKIWVESKGEGKGSTFSFIIPSLVV